VSGRQALALHDRFKEEAVLAHVVHSPPTLQGIEYARGGGGEGACITLTPDRGISEPHGATPSWLNP
jgi:hypothetical protein